MIRYNDDLLLVQSRRDKRAPCLREFVWNSNFLNRSPVRPPACPSARPPGPSPFRQRIIFSDPPAAPAALPPTK